MKHTLIALCVVAWLIGPQVTTVSAQRVFPDPEFTEDVRFPENYAGTDARQDDQLVEQTGIRYGMWSTSMFDINYANYSVVWDMFEKMPAALMQTTSSGSQPLPVWDFRYWPASKKYSWLVSGSPTKGPIAIIADEQLRVVDSLPIGDPHEFVILPDNQGYLYLLSNTKDAAGNALPGIVWLNKDKSYKWSWSASDGIFGLVADSSLLANCYDLAPVPVDTDYVDWFHPNSLAWIPETDSSWYVGILLRNVNAEVRLQVVDRIGKSLITKQRWIFDNAGKSSLFVDDSSWVEGPHALNYRYLDKDTLYVEIWDNAVCTNSSDASNYRLYKSYPDATGQDRLMQQVRYQEAEGGQLGPAMGNGYALTNYFLVENKSELMTAPLVYNLGTGFHPDNSMFGVATATEEPIFRVFSSESFVTYRFHAFLDSQIPNIDQIRPRLSATLVGDSVVLTASGNFQNYKWLNGLEGKTKKVSIDAYCSEDFAVLAKNNDQSFWFSSHRYYKEAAICGTGIQTITKSQLQVYPNPVQQGGTLQLGTQASSVNLYDLAGRNILRTEAPNGSIKLPDNLQEGLYQLEVDGQVQRLLILR